MATRPLTRTSRTMRRMGPLAREIQAVQNDLVKLARKLDRLQTVIQAFEGEQEIEAAERRRLHPDTAEALRLANVRKAREIMRGGK